MLPQSIIALLFSTSLVKCSQLTLLGKSYNDQFMTEKINSALSHSLGDLIQWGQEKSGLTGETKNGKFRIQLYNENIVRIQVTQEKHFEDFSYSVIATPQAVSVTVLEQEDNLV